jgi:hypothetical protein
MVRNHGRIQHSDGGTEYRRGIGACIIRIDPLSTLFCDFLLVRSTP